MIFYQEKFICSLDIKFWRKFLQYEKTIHRQPL